MSLWQDTKGRDARIRVITGAPDTPYEIFLVLGVPLEHERLVPELFAWEGSLLPGSNFLPFSAQLWHH